MQKTNDYSHGVKSLVSMAQKINPEIGSYQEHFINESFDFTVKLSNGRLNVSRVAAQDFEAQPNSISEGQIRRIADSFNAE